MPILPQTLGASPQKHDNVFTAVCGLCSVKLQAKGLSVCLERQGIRYIREQKVKVGIVGKDSVVQPEEPRGPSPLPNSTATIPAPEPSTWDIEAGTDDIFLGQAFPKFEPLPSKINRHQPPLQSFVVHVLHSLQKRMTSLHEAAEVIAREFEQRLNEKVEEIRHVDEAKLRRLEKVKGIMLKELENLHVAAIVLDAEMAVVGANDSGRKLIGTIEKIEKDSPIYRFVELKLERLPIEINGVSRLAHIILSTARDKREGTMLICLE